MNAPPVRYRDIPSKARTITRAQLAPIGMDGSRSGVVGDSTKASVEIGRE